MIRKQLSHRPTMLCYSRCHRRRSLYPLVPANQSLNSQALVLTAEVVNRSHQIHPCCKCFALSSHCPPSPHKAGQALSKRRVESLDESRVDYPSSLCSLNHSFNLSLAAFNDSPSNADHSPSLVLLYGLCDEDSLPALQTRTANPSGRHSLTKDIANCSYVSLQSTCAQQDASTQSCSTGSHLLNQRSYKSSVAAGRNNSAQPQARAYHPGQSHPNYAALLFNSKLIHLHLSKITRRGNELVVNRFTMPTSPRLPTRHGPLVKRESSNDGLRRAAKRQQSDNLIDQFLRVSKTVIASASGLRKGLVTDRALLAAIFERMHADVAFACFASGRTVHIRTKYFGRVQVGNPFRFCDEIQKGLSLDPRFIQNHLLHALLWTYLGIVRLKK